MKNKRVAISGNIGVGKSTLGENLSNLDGFKYYKEDVNRELLELFTKQVITKEIKSDTPVELLHQLNFLNNTIVRDIKSDYYKSFDYHVFDRAIFEHIHIFARKTLKPRDWALFNGMQEILLANLKWDNYDLNIILQDDIENVYKKVNNRSRNDEELTEEYKLYLKELNDMYNSDYFVELAKQYSEKVHVLDVRGLSQDEVKKAVIEIINERDDNENN